MQDKSSQCERIYEYIKQHGSITPLEALDHIGCMRLASRISEMRQRNIPVKMVPVNNGVKRFAKYILDVKTETERKPDEDSKS